MHTWINAGRLQDEDSNGEFAVNQYFYAFPHLNQPVRSTLHTLLTRPSVSAGLGLIYRLDPVRVEANVTFPLAAARGEGLRRGVQVGIGLEML